MLSGCVPLSAWEPSLCEGINIKWEWAFPLYSPPPPLHYCLLWRGLVLGGSVPKSTHPQRPLVSLNFGSLAERKQPVGQVLLQINCQNLTETCSCTAMYWQHADNMHVQPITPTRLVLWGRKRVQLRPPPPQKKAGYYTSTLWNSFLSCFYSGSTSLQVVQSVHTWDIDFTNQESMLLKLHKTNFCT